MSLSTYRRKLRSSRSPEPPGRRGAKRRRRRRGPCFVLQGRAASGDHYDFRLEIDGVLVSWAIPKGPATNPTTKRMARRSEDHPLEYPAVETVTPDAECGSGAVVVFDRGTYTNVTRHAMGECLRRGHVSFYLRGEKLRGGYALTRIREGDEETWLLIKRKDKDVNDVDAQHQQVQSRPESVLSDRTADEHNELP